MHARTPTITISSFSALITPAMEIHIFSGSSVNTPADTVFQEFQNILGLSEVSVADPV